MLTPLFHLGSERNDSLVVNVTVDWCSVTLVPPKSESLDLTKSINEILEVNGDTVYTREPVSGERVQVENDEKREMRLLQVGQMKITCTVTRSCVIETIRVYWSQLSPQSPTPPPPLMWI